MRSRLLLLVVALPVIVAPDLGAAPGPPVARCNPAPIDCTGWYRGDVTISWVYDMAGVTETEGCNVRTITADTADAPQTCTVKYGAAIYGFTAHVKRDATPPQVTGAALARPPDANGWFNRPVGLSVAAADATSGLASCDQPTYSGPDSGSVSLSAACRDVAGNVASTAVSLKYDATAPSVTAAPDRPPDGNGWYRKPLTVSFAGADATSGIAACTEPARYAGPDRADARLAGTCRDHAGNAAEAALVLDYDATAPRLTALEAKVQTGSARLAWRKAADTVLVRIEREPGINGRKRTQVYKGTGQSFVDRTVRKGVRYRYELTSTDPAGNVFASELTAHVARPVLYAPAPNAVVRGPVRLRWEKQKGARYYNVQLHRNGVKVLTAWPRGPSYRIPKAWRFAGRRETLRPGNYRWFVWPARGTRVAPNYGKVLGTSTFRVR